MPPDRDERAGGGGPSGGGAGHGGAAGPPSPRAGTPSPGGMAPAQPAAGAETKLLGCQPAIFNGDYTRADNFIEEVKGYFRVNAQVPDMQSWLRKIAFTLTLIKGL